MIKYIIIFIIIIILLLVFSMIIHNKLINELYTIPTKKFIIRKSLENNQVKNIYTIPKRIYFTYHDLNKIPPHILNDIYKYCHDYEIFIFNDDMCIEFLNEYYGQDAVNIFNNMRIGAYKSDFWRYCILFIFGGYYFDIKTIFIKHIQSIFTQANINKTWYTVIGKNMNSIYNGIIATPPFNPCLWDAILFIYKNSISMPINYGIYVNELYNIIKRYNITKKVHIGLNNQKNGWSCILLEETCITCNPKLKSCDKYGFNCIISNSNKIKCFNTRHPDFPWK